MMFQGAETGLMSPEDNAKHKSSEDPKQQNKSSHGNEVKYFTRCNTTISIFHPFDFTQIGLPSKENYGSAKQFFVHVTSVLKRTIRRGKGRFSKSKLPEPKGYWIFKQWNTSSV